MARPLTASDEDIMRAARRVLARRGPDAFSIAEVASEVGLSRAAIILRFKGTQALKVLALKAAVAEFDEAINQVPKTVGGDGLLQLAAFIGTYMRSRGSSAKFFMNYTTQLGDRELMKLEVQRGESLNKAITAVMPPTNIAREDAVILFRAHLTGCIFAWLSRTDDIDSRTYLVQRTCDWLTLAGIPFSKEFAAELSSTPPAQKKTRVPRSSGTRKKAAFGARR